MGSKFVEGNDLKNKKKLNLHILSEYRNELYGASILWILLFHSYLCDVYYFEGIPVLKYFGKFLNYGNVGVDVFLFLSGISLYFSFVRNSDIICFMKKRMIRIFQPVLICCGTYWIVMFLCKQYDFVGVLSRLTTLRFWITGDQQIWFVSLILLCYFVYPYIYHFLFDKEMGSVKRAVWLIGTILIVNVILMYGHQDTYNRIEIAITRIPVFLLGCVAGKFVYEKKELPGSIWYVCVIVAIACFVIRGQELLHGMSSRYMLGVCGVAMTFLFAGAFKYLPDVIRKFFRFLGGMSLELYLFNILTKRLYEGGYLWKYEPGNTLRYLAVVVFCIIGAALVSKIEKYMLRGGRK